MKSVIAIISKGADRPKGFSKPGKDHERPALWLVSERDAQKICGSTETVGQNYALFYFNIDEKENRNFAFVKDDGRFNVLLKSLSVNILQSKEKGYTHPYIGSAFVLQAYSKHLNT